MNIKAELIEIIRDSQGEYLMDGVFYFMLPRRKDIHKRFTPGFEQGIFKFENNRFEQVVKKEVQTYGLIKNAIVWASYDNDVYMTDLDNYRTEKIYSIEYVGVAPSNYVNITCNDHVTISGGGLVRPELSKYLIFWYDGTRDYNYSSSLKLRDGSFFFQTLGTLQIGDKIYYSSEERIRDFALLDKNENLIWHRSIMDYLTDRSLPRYERLQFMKTRIIDEKIVLLFVEKGQILAIDKDSGEMIWSFDDFNKWNGGYLSTLDGCY